MNLGQDNIIKVYAGTSEVSKIYLGSDLVFSVNSKWTPPPYNTWAYTTNGTWINTQNTMTDSYFPGTENYPNKIWDVDGGGGCLVGGTGWIGFYTDPIKVNSYSFFSDDNAYCVDYHHWEGSNDGINWVVLSDYNTYSNPTDRQTFTIPEANRNYYPYNRLFVQNTDSPYQNIVRALILDADVAPGVSNKWSQPTLTSDTLYGTISSSVTAWGDSPAYQLSDGVIGSSKWGAIAPNGASITWALPSGIKMQSCKVYQTNETPVLNRFPTSINIYGSNDNSSWDNIGSLTVNSIPSSEDYVTVNCSTNNFYSYYRWDFGASTNANGELAVCELVIDAIRQY